LKRLVLGIETSCDETSVAVVSNGREILSNVIASQIDIHKRFGGVVPEIASRQHLEMITPIIKEALAKAGVSLQDIQAIAVTKGPGLVGSLLIGLSAGKALAWSLDIPLLGVHHMAGHIYANFLIEEDRPYLEPYEDMQEKTLCLVVSGGHTDLVYLEGPGRFKVLGQTRDDAAGEAFDKVARVLKLPYPGGPAIDKLAQEGNPEAIRFPRSYLEKGSYDFSFSGLKTAVSLFMQKEFSKGEYALADVAASFQEAVAEVLVEKTRQAAEERGIKRILLAGGVAANSALRRKMTELGEKEGYHVHYPSLKLCTDNAAMIAGMGYYQWQQGLIDDLDLDAVAQLPLEDLSILPGK